VGLVGLGKMGGIHMQNSLHINDIKIVAAADSSKKALNEAKSFGIDKLYTDYHDLLTHAKSTNIDTVIISLPNFLHFEAIQLALEAGLNVFTEKPMANTLEECQKIVNLVERSGLKLMVGHNFRFLKTIERMKDILNKGYIGKLEAITIEMMGNGPFSSPIIPKPVSEWWLNSKKAGGGVLIDYGCHLIDLFRYFVGDANLLFSYLDYKFNLPFEDAAILILSSSDSYTKGTINTGWYQKENFATFDFRVILHGNAGFIASDNFTPTHFYLYAMKEGIKNLSRRIIGKEIHWLSYYEVYESYYKELEHFYKCVRNDLNLSIGASAIDGLKATEIIEKVYKISTLNNVYGES
jgi:myo-inositol 2-dehydrogenase/D-chiro-inositol 1-dehydrogenase